jgi:Holliday junction resolvasome RuvABC DNA-binding subunit
MIDAGVQGLSHILEMTDEMICSIEGIGPKTAEKIRQAAEEAKAEWDKRDAEEAARYAAEQAAAEAAAAAEQAAADEAATQEAEPAAETVPAVAGSDGQEGSSDDER